MTPQFGPLGPLGTGNTGFTVSVAPDWAGMQDTTYQFTLTTTSTADTDDIPPAHHSVTVSQTVVATKQSMTRYIDLELADLALQIQNANTAGINTGGALPIVTNDLQRANQRALSSILASDLVGASNTLSTEIHSVDAFLKAISGPTIPAALVADWTARANAIRLDMGVAQASTVTSQ